jgi:hypothetical protein
MPVQVVHARLSQQDAMDLARARKELDAIYDSIAATNTQSKPLIMASLVDVASVLDKLLHKEMLAWERFKERGGTVQGNGAIEERSACAVSDGNPGADQGGAPELEPTNASRGP